MQLWCQKFK